MHRLRFLVAVASLILAVTSTLTMGLSAAKAIDMVRLLLAGGGKSDQTLVVLLNVVDLILIATVQVIIALGLWELFVDDLDLPDWLTVHSLSDLKGSLSEALVLVFAIKFFERLLASTALNALYDGAAVALVSGALIALSAVHLSRVQSQNQAPNVRAPADQAGPQKDEDNSRPPSSQPGP